MIEIQKEYGGDVLAFHSVLHGFSKSGSSKEKDMTQGKKALSDVEKLFKEANLTVETRLIEDVHPEDFIKDIVEKEEFNLVVLGNKGKHKLLRHAVLGSVPTKVMNSVLCDVLVVR